MVEGCGAKCIKFILFIVNVLFFLIGGAAVGLGIFALVDKSKLITLTKIGNAENYDVTSLLEAGAYCLIIGGAVVMILAFLGCCGAMRDSKILLGLYAFLMIIIVILEIAAVVIGIVFSNKVASELKTVMKDRITKEYDGVLKTGDPFTLAMDFAQVYFECCGVDNYKDYSNTTKWNRTMSDGKVAVMPKTCCILNNKDAYFDDPSAISVKSSECQTTYASATSYGDKGCYDSILDWAKRNAGIVIGIGVGIVVMEILCIVFACCLISALRKEQKD